MTSNLIKEYVSLLLEEKVFGIKRIREIIRQLVYRKREKGVACKVRIKKQGEFIYVTYEDPDRSLKGSICIAKVPKRNGKDRKAGTRDVYEVIDAYSDSPWGPLLYEVALEYISVEKKGALMSDRSTVLDPAVKVWSIYNQRCLSNEPNLGCIQMDFDISVYRAKIKKYTPDNELDDVSQDSTFAALLRSGIDVKDLDREWKNSALSKAYYKKSYDAKNALERLDLLVIDEGL